MKFGKKTAFSLALALALAMPTSGFAYIDTDLKLGSSGEEVSFLQEVLVEEGYLVMPEGVNLGYFGALTKEALSLWQASRGVPATGYFGPMSREVFNSEVSEITVGGEVVASTSMMATTLLSKRVTLHPATPDVKVISKSISPGRATDGSVSSAVSKIKIKITANEETIYLNGDNEVTDGLQFLNVSVYGSGISASTTATTTSYEIAGGSDYTVTNDGADDEYYTLDEGESMIIEITSTLAQDMGTEEVVLAGVKADTLRFGIDDSSDASRGEIEMDLTYLGEQMQSGTVEFLHDQ
ncbi:MAG: peptidoglycan-binding domain-containing protein [Minisyncoccota bacterium]